MIILPDYLERLGTIPHINAASVMEHGDVSFGKKWEEGCEYLVSWGYPVEGGKNGVLETGFFWEAAHIDTMGLYANSSLNTAEAIREVEEFIPPSGLGHLPSKYRQTDNKVEWSGVVLACQNPTDRSIQSCGSPEDFYEFVKGACEYFGKELFLKLHPWNSTKEVVDRLHGYAVNNGCEIAKTDHSVINNCEFVLVYNSTFAMDCFVRGVPVVQYAPGYWHKTPAVTYADGNFMGGMDTVEWGRMLADFVVWRYCFDYTMPASDWVEMIKEYRDSTKLFPLPIEYSYGARR
jgi:hypothetical protein